MTPNGMRFIHLTQPAARRVVAVARGRGAAEYLPSTRYSPPRAQSAPDASTPPSVPPTVLVLDDDEAVRAMCAELLELRGYRVLRAARGEEALGLLRTADPPVRLLLSDVVMPGMSGPEVARLALAAHPGLVVLFMSGYAAVPLIDDGAVRSRVAFLPKPFSASVLTDKVRALLSRGPAEHGTMPEFAGPFEAEQRQRHASRAEGTGALPIWY